MTQLEANLRHLPPATASTIREAEPRFDEIVIRARDGSVVNGIENTTGSFLFHSRYDPHREARLLATRAAGAGYVVAVGAGVGHHIRALAQTGATVVVVEPDAALVRTALARVDFEDLLESGSVWIAHPRETGAGVLARYVPAINGDLAVVELTGRTRSEPMVFGPLLRRIATEAENTRRDLAVQARFGLRWMRNTILNIPNLPARSTPVWNGEHVIAAAAGPSLTDAMPLIHNRGRRRLLAADTALPVLIANGVRPDLVISIDCQVTTYHHFLTAGFPKIPVAAELSLPPSLYERLAEPVPLVSDHPLHRLLVVLGLRATYVDARGGNVGQAAVDLAARLGAAGVTLVGADFAYPDGETYPRGSYVHRHFESIATRFAPLAGHHYAFLVERPGVARDPRKASRWTQPLLDDYATGMAAFVDLLPVPVQRITGRGRELPHADPTTDRVWTPGTGIVDSPGTTPTPLAILRQLADALRSVEKPDVFTAELSRGLQPVAGEPSHYDERRALAARALLPLLTWLRAREPDLGFDQLLSRAQAVSLRLIAQAKGLATGA